jgi:hypothetical protein
MILKRELLFCGRQGDRPLMMESGIFSLKAIRAKATPQLTGLKGTCPQR